MHTLESLINQAGELPALPEIYIRVTELLENESSTTFQIGEAVQTDPALTARILKLINSAYIGLRNPVTSISQALTLLGRKQLQQVLTGSVLSGVFKDFDISGFPIRDFWRHCIKTAIICRHLAMQNAHIIDHEAFFTAGLLHDIGWLVIAKVKPGAYLEITGLTESESKEVIELEARQLGVTHIDVGVALLKKWGIPNQIVQCVKKHHETEHTGPFSVETSIVYLANRLDRLDRRDLGGQEEEVDEQEYLEKSLSVIPSWEEARCTIEQISIACRLAEEQWLQVMEALGMLDLEITDEQDESFVFNTSVGRI